MDRESTSVQIIKELEEMPEYGKLYKEYVVQNHVKTEKKNYTKDKVLITELIADFILKKIEQDNSFRLAQVDKNADYSSGGRWKDKGIASTSIKDLLIHIYQDSNGTGTSKKIEDKAVHCFQKLQKIGEYSFVDYQVPTSRGGGDKIDLLLRNSDDLLVVEYKKLPEYINAEQLKFDAEELNFDEIVCDTASKETLLRCVFEIKTYFDKLNEEFCQKYNTKVGNVKMAVMFDKHSQAYKDFSDREKNKNVLKLMKIWGVTALELIVSQNGFDIKELV